MEWNSICTAYVWIKAMFTLKSVLNPVCLPCFGGKHFEFGLKIELSIKQFNSRSSVDQISKRGSRPMLRSQRRMRGESVLQSWLGHRCTKMGNVQSQKLHASLVVRSYVVLCWVNPTHFWIFRVNLDLRRLKQNLHSYNLRIASSAFA
jgi:hypothetical protein